MPDRIFDQCIITRLKTPNKCNVNASLVDRNVELTPNNLLENVC